MLQRAERRSDPRKRAVACRDAILDWCYSHMSARDINEFTADVRANLEGDPFTDEEIISASRDLQETESHDQLVRIIEERPESCRVTETRGPPSRAVETSSAYLRARARPCPPLGADTCHRKPAHLRRRVWLGSVLHQWRPASCSVWPDIGGIAG
jgi:hypothetical protein